MIRVIVELGRRILGDVGVRTYRFVIQGELSDEMAPSFDGMTLTRAGGTTVLTGKIRDQAELHGLLQRFGDFGLTLIEMTVLDRAAEPAKALS